MPSTLSTPPSSRLKDDIANHNLSDGNYSEEEDFDWDELDALGELATLSESHRQDLMLEGETIQCESEDSDTIPVCQWANCGIQFYRLHQLVSHISEDHVHRGSASKSESAPWTCEWDGCTRKAIPHSSRNALISHMRGHTGEKPFSCPECPKRFPRADAMQKHIKNHHQQHSHPPSPSPSNVFKSPFKKLTGKKPVEVKTLSTISSNHNLTSHPLPSSSDNLLISSELGPEKLHEIQFWLDSTFSSMPLFVVKQNNNYMRNTGYVDHEEQATLLQIDCKNTTLDSHDKYLLANYYVSMQERHYLLSELKILHSKLLVLATQITKYRDFLILKKDEQSM